MNKIIGFLQSFNKKSDFKSTNDLENANDVSSLNQTIKNQQTKKMLLIVGIIFIVVLIIWFYTREDKKDDAEQKIIPEITSGVITQDFTQKNTVSALQDQQSKIDLLEKELKKLTDETAKNEENKKTLQVVEELKNKISNLEKGAPKILSAVKDISNTNQYALDGEIHQSNAIATTTFSYNYEITRINERENKTYKTPANYVPAGTFARAVLLGGADANASVNGQSSTSPILLRILDNGMLPNGKKSKLKGCFVIASVYGDISSERGEVRLQNLSCTRKDSTILDVQVEGTVFGMEGKEGIRGIPVMRNGQILWYAGISGLFSGIGTAVQQAQTTQSISSLGSTQTVNSNRILQYGAYGGVGTALGKMADYYIKRADQYHPIIQISAGSKVDLVFQKGFFLNTDENPNFKTLKKQLKEKLVQTEEITKKEINETSNTLNEDSENKKNENDLDALAAGIK